MTDAQDGYGRPADGGEIERAGALLAESFAIPPAHIGPWFDYAGRENIRVFRKAGSVAGALLLVPMGQFWGGRSVRLCGFAGVGVAPWERGHRVATLMMAEALRELRRDGWPLAALYPSTQPLYRRVGFEQAGSRFEIRGPLSALPCGDRDLPMRPFTPAELPAAQRTYSEVARARPGWLDRGGYVWHRVQNPRPIGQPSAVAAYGYICGEPGAVEGYAFLTRVPKPAFRPDVLVTDLVARSARASRRLLTFLSDQASISEDVSWFSGAAEPLLLLLREQAFDVHAVWAWMLRLVDVEQAIAARGYLSGLSATLEIDLVDELFADNAGRWILEISGGEGRARRGGSGKLRCDARALASMFSGFRNASALSALGIVQGPPEALSAADAIFAGPPPSMPDMF